MISKQHKRKNTATKKVEPNEGERTLLCCNNCGRRSPSLDLPATISQKDQKLIEALAQIITEAIIWRVKHDSNRE